MHLKKMTVCIFLLLYSLFCSFTILADTATECQNLAKEVNSDLRSIDRIRDADVALSKLSEIRTKIDKIRSLDPNFSQINILESKYKRLYKMYGGTEKAEAEAVPSVDNTVKEQALKDWEAIVQLEKEFVTELETVIPTYVKNVIYSESNVDEVVTKIQDLRQRIPEITAFLKDFSNQYGDSREKIDKKLIELTPKDPSAGMYDPVNQRPSDSGGLCYETLVQGLTNLEEAPKIEAKRILTQALQQLDQIESFIADTYRDQKYSEVEAKIQMGLKFNPEDLELKQWAQKIPELRQKSKEDIEKTLDQATFPDHMTGFTGPGNVDQLSASIIQYYNDKDKSQTTLAVSIAGNWVSAKKNIFGQTIQWGLPIWAASVKKENPDIARVFKLTILTKEELGVQKSPPWTGDWVGDSYRMRAKNIK